MGPALSSASKDSLSGRGQPSGSLCPSSSPAPGPTGPRGVAPARAVPWHVRIPRRGPRFSSAGAECSPGPQRSLSLPRKLVLGWGEWCPFPREQSSGPECRRKRESAFTCAILYVKACLPVLYHTAQLLPHVGVPTTRQF